jgi:hypothetical protein
VTVAKVVGVGMDAEMPSRSEADVSIWKLLCLTIDRECDAKNRAGMRKTRMRVFIPFHPSSNAIARNSAGSASAKLIIRLPEPC